jgi:hypothetical protein
VSVKNVKKAKSQIDSADPALLKLIEEPGSKLSLDAAVQVAAMPKYVQREIAERVSKFRQKKQKILGAGSYRHPTARSGTSHLNFRLVKNIFG